MAVWASEMAGPAGAGGAGCAVVEGGSTGSGVEAPQATTAASGARAGRRRRMEERRIGGKLVPAGLGSYRDRAARGRYCVEQSAASGVGGPLTLQCVTR